MSQAHCVIFWAALYRAKGYILMTLVGPFLLRIIFSYNSTNSHESFLQEGLLAVSLGGAKPIGIVKILPAVISGEM